jgi:ABC-type uncharacterized transport system substrate-binding protein
MKRAAVPSILVAVVLLAVGVTAEAQQPKKVQRIGYLSPSDAATESTRSEPIRRALRELGYIEGQNISFEYRYAEGKQQDRYPEFLAELVHLKVDVIVTGGGGGATRSAKGATVTIPIVMAMDNDPVGQGFVASLARPGGNITGLSTLAPEISGKRLELLKEIIPKLSRVVVLGTSTGAAATSLKEVERAAGALKMKLQYLDVLSPKDIETAFREASKGRAEAVLVLPGPVFGPRRKQLADVAAKSRLPAIYPFPEFVEAGGLMSYSANITDLFRRAATYVDKILKGRKPADLPVEQPTKFELIINLKAAKQIGLTIPPNVLVRADRVIK